MVIIVAPDTKVWCLLLHQTPIFSVAKVKIHSDHFAQRLQKKDVQKLLQEIQDLSRC